MSIILHTVAKYDDPFISIRRPKYLNKLTDASLSARLYKKTRSLKILRELSISKYDPKKFFFFRRIISSHSKTLRKHVAAHLLNIFSKETSIVSLDTRLPQLKNYFLTLSNQFSLRRFLYFHNIESLSIQTELSALINASGMEIKNEWFYIEPFMHRLKRHLKGLSKLKKIVVYGSFDLICRKTLEALNQCVNHLPSLKDLVLFLTSRNNKTIPKKKGQKESYDFSIYKHVTKLELQEMQNMVMTNFLLDHTSELQNLKALVIECPTFQEADSSVLKNISKLSSLTFLKVNLSLASKKDWKGLFESITFPNTLKEMSFSIYGGIPMDQLAGNTGKDWEIRNPCEKNKTCQKLFSEWAKIQDLKRLQFKIEWVKFKNWYFSFVIGCLKKIKSLERLDVQIECPEFDEMFYDKFSTQNENHALNVSYLFITLQPTLDNIQKLILHAPLLTFSGFPKNKSLSQLNFVEIIGKTKGEGMEDFLEVTPNLESLDLNWISIRNEETLSLLVAPLFKLEKLYMMSLVFETTKISAERLFEKMTHIAKRSKAKRIHLETLQEAFSEKQLVNLGTYLLDVSSKKRVSIQSKCDTFLYDPEFKSYSFNLSGKYKSSSLYDV